MAVGLSGSRAFCQKTGSRALWLKGFVAHGPVAQGPVAQRPVAQVH